MLHFRNNSKIKYQNRREGQNRYPFTYMAGNYSNLVLVQLIIVCHLFFFLFWSLFCLFFFDLLFLITYLVSSKNFHVRCHASMGRYGTFLSRYGNLTHFDPMKNILLLVYDTSKQNSWIYKDKFTPRSFWSTSLTVMFETYFCINTKRKIYSTGHFSM
jgi:hypothetical protein